MSRFWLMESKLKNNVLAMTIAAMSIVVLNIKKLNLCFFHETFQVSAFVRKLMEKSRKSSIFLFMAL